MIMRLRLTLAGSPIGGLMIWACGGEETTDPAPIVELANSTSKSVVVNEPFMMSSPSLMTSKATVTPPNREPTAAGLDCFHLFLDSSLQRSPQVFVAHVVGIRIANIAPTAPLSWIGYAPKLHTPVSDAGQSTGADSYT